MPLPPARILATDRHHLEDLIRLSVAQHGPEADLNHIDPSNVGGRVRLCMDQPHFRGDFSSWNTVASDAASVTLAQVVQEPVIAGDKAHLQTLIGKAIGINGDRCDLNHIDITEATDLTDLFRPFPYFNGDISRWDTSRVTTMAGMFRKSKDDAFVRGKASLFRGDISQWNTANVQDMSHMFEGSQFNGDLSRWDTSRVTDMYGMFKDAHFRGDISAWNTRSVRNMSVMFVRSQFNGDISRWNVANVVNFAGMFARSMFKGDLSQWNTASARDTSQMFEECPFNGDIARWNVASVLRMREMFRGGAFAQDISAWTLSPLFESKDLVRLYHNNPGFLAAQSMSPWIVRLHLANGVVPKDPAWTCAFRDVAPIAKGLCLGPQEHAEAVVAAYEGVLERTGDFTAPFERVNGAVFQQ